MRIGIPRALGDFYYHSLWERFFAGLGHEVVHSRPSNRLTLDSGCAVIPGEACLPLKCFAGHVRSLAASADCIFVPRLVCLRTVPRIRLGCPKFIGLPDVIRAVCPEVDLLTIDIDLRVEPEAQSFAGLSRRLGCTPTAAESAYWAARAEWTRAECMRAEWNEGERCVRAGESGHDVAANPSRDARDPAAPLRIGLLGHAYLLDDSYLGFHAAARIRDLGCEILHCHHIAPAVLEEERRRIRSVSWHFEEDILCAASVFLRDHSIAGIVHLLSFACGAGSITSELIELEARGESETPLLRLVIDDHTGDAGLRTRLESFVDMLAMKRAAHTHRGHAQAVRS